MEDIFSFFNRTALATLKIQKRILELEEQVRSLNSFCDKLRAIEAPDDARKEGSITQVAELMHECKDTLDRFNSAAIAGGHGKWPDYRDLSATAKNLVKRSIQLRERHVWPDEMNLGEMNLGFKPTAKSGGGPSAHEPQPPETNAEVDEPVGIDGPIEMLVKWLLEEEKRLQVVSIVGPAGSGKKTLAKAVYNKITGYERRFKSMAAVSSSHRDPEELLKQIMTQVNPDGPHPSELETWVQGKLIASIREYLRDKRYIILIKDISNKECWEVIHSIFPKNDCGSRIIITTRVKSVAGLCRSHRDGLVYDMKPFDELDSRRLLLGDPNVSDYEITACDKVQQKYDGKPLAMVTIADMMKEQNPSSKVAWLEEFCKLRKVPHLKELKERFSPSYNDLPSDMKLSLLYVSLFPDCKIDKDRLLRRWVAEGFVTSQTERTATAEEKAQEYLSRFIDRNIIRTEKCRSTPVVEICKADYFMLQVMLSDSPERHFMITSDTIDLMKEPNKVRHLSLHYPDPELDAVLEKLDLSPIHSLTIYDGVLPVPLQKFTRLQVLDLDGWKKLVDDDMLKICKTMFLLKYLSIKQTAVTKLPSDIKKLNHLETLDIRQTQIKMLPSELCKLRNLRTLDLRRTEVTALPDKVIQLPTLLYLLVGDDDSDERLKMPERVHQLRSLRTLATVDLSNCSSSVVQSLGGLTNLRELAIIWSFHQSADTEYQDALRSSIKELRLLKSLTIYGHFGCSMEFLGDLPHPPRELEKLTVTGRFVSVPQWIEGLRALVLLEVKVCKLGVKVLG